MESTVVKSETSHQASGTQPHIPVSVRGPFELEARDNALVESLAARMYFVGWVTLTVGIFVVVLGACLFSVPSILSGMLYSVIGLWTHRASVSFKKVGETQGQDLSHLIFAIRDLRNLYSLQVWICTFTLAAAVFGVFTLLWQGRL